MKTKLVPSWLRTVSNIAIFLPMLGFYSQILDSPYFKQYLADVIINIANSFSSALINLAIDAIFTTA